MAVVATGARAQLKIDGKIVGFIGNVSVSVETTLSDVDVIGDIDVADLAETGRKVSFQASYVRMLGRVKGPGQEGQVGANSATGLALYQDNQAFLKNKPEFVCELLSEDGAVTDIVLAGCKLQSWEGSVEARGVMSGTFQFRAKRAKGC